MAKKEKTAIKTVQTKKKKTAGKTVLKVSENIIDRDVDIVAYAETDSIVATYSYTAYTAILSTLTYLDEFNFRLISFNNRPNVKISDLKSYNSIASSDMTQANFLANKIDLELQKRDGSYKPGVDATNAISNMAAVLRDGNKIVKDLIDKVEEYYIFSPFS